MKTKNHHNQKQTQMTLWSQAIKRKTFLMMQVVVNRHHKHRHRNTKDTQYDYELVDIGCVRETIRLYKWKWRNLKKGFIFDIIMRSDALGGRPVHFVMFLGYRY